MLSCSFLLLACVLLSTAAPSPEACEECVAVLFRSTAPRLVLESLVREALGSRTKLSWSFDPRAASAVVALPPERHRTNAIALCALRGGGAALAAVLRQHPGVVDAALAPPSSTRRRHRRRSRRRLAAGSDAYIEELGEELAEYYDDDDEASEVASSATLASSAPIMGNAAADARVAAEEPSAPSDLEWFLSREPAELKLYSLIYDHRQTLKLPWPMIAKQLCASTELSDEAPWWCDSQAGIVGVGARTCRTLFRTRYGGDKMARSATRRGDAWLAIDQYHVRKLHARNITGSRVKIGIFDSGIGRALDTAEVRRAQYAVNVTKIRTTWHPHTNRTLKTCHDFTGKDKGCKGKARCSCSDTLGHGNLAAGIVTGESDMCPGLAPNAELHMFKVFDKVQATSAGWLIDALNDAIFLELDILILPYGGFPNFRERPVMDKINEILSEGVVVISACGNEGPIFGSHLSPSDHAAVLSVGALERWMDKKKVPLGGVDAPGSVMDVSGRGFTNWESPTGAGRFKPEMVAHGFDVWGPSMVWTNDAVDVCKRHWGTSVAATLVGGAAALMISSLPDAERRILVNPASIKQAFIATAERLPPMKYINPLAMGLMEPIENTILEQGAGMMRVEAAIEYMRKTGPHVSAWPSSLNLTDCPYMWPYCEQPMYAGAMPILINVSLINSMGVTGKVHRPCEWVPDDPAVAPMLVECKFPSRDDDMWPWVGWVGLSITIASNASDFAGVVSGTVKILVTSSAAPGAFFHPTRRTTFSPPHPRTPLPSPLSLTHPPQARASSARRWHLSGSRSALYQPHRVRSACCGTSITTWASLPPSRSTAAFRRATVLRCLATILIGMGTTSSRTTAVCMRIFARRGTMSRSLTSRLRASTRSSTACCWLSTRRMNFIRRRSRSSRTMCEQSSSPW